MLLHNLHLVEKKDFITDIKIQGEVIFKMGRQQQTHDSIDLENLLAFPGLINAHDHLDFNLFPQLGSKYNNYTEWGGDIHSRHKKEIESVLKISKQLRIKWGMVKNILNGVTTVVDHSKEHQDLMCEYINIVGHFTYLHSVALEKFWRLKMNNPFSGEPIMVHIGEGIDQEAYAEMNKLVKWNIFRKDLIGIHGIAMDERQAAHFKALVWCPASNYFLYDQTARIDLLKDKTRILFGTDSALSASVNLWEHLRLARKQQMLTDQELFHALTTTAADVFKLKNTGMLKEGKCADLVIGRKKHDTLWDSFYTINPEDIMMVIKAGKIIYYDDELTNRLNALSLDDYMPIRFGNSKKHVLPEIAAVIKELETLQIKLPLDVKTIPEQ